MALDQKFVTKVITVAQIIDELDYYKILSVTQAATMGQIRQAYHKQSRMFHPDRFFTETDEAFKTSVYRISKRVTEAYVTLRDAQKRSYYDQQLAAGQIRYTEQSAQKQKKAKVEEIGKTEQGRKMYAQGLREYKAKKYETAERSFKMAMVYEPENELFKKMAREASDNIKTDFRIK